MKTISLIFGILSSILVLLIYKIPDMVDATQADLICACFTCIMCFLIYALEEIKDKINEK